MIPKKIHQIWQHGDVPEKYIAFQNKVKELHPEWEYKLWNEDDNLALVKSHFPDFFETYIGLPRNIMRADMIRYLIMYQVGGVYLDLDYEMLKPFDLINHDLVLPYNRNLSFGDPYDAFGNCIFGSAPNHPFWMFVIKDLKGIKNYEEFFKSLSDKPYIDRYATIEEAITGPGLLTRIFFTYKDKLKNYILPEREAFHPVNPSNLKEYTKILAKGNSYGIHHCSGTWRDKSFLKKVKRRIKILLKIR